MLVEHGELHVRLQREAPSTGILVHQTLRGGGGWGENAVLYLQDSLTVDPDVEIAILYRQVLAVLI